MPVKVIIPSALRAYTNQQSEVLCAGATVAEVFSDLMNQHPELRKHLFADDRSLRRFVNVYVNETDIRHLKGEQTSVAARDVVSIIPSVAGGSASDAQAFSRPELERYSRHLLMPEIGVEGQTLLKRARVLIVGAGGLGTPAAIYLAAAGVGTLGLVDDDVVDISNLHRQVLYTEADIGRPKLAVAQERLQQVNPQVELRTHAVRLTSENALQLFADYDFILDGTDNFPTRYLVNDACVLTGKPNIYGSIFRFEGQVSVFGAPDGPCYRCLYPEPPPPGLVPSCAEGGVLGILPGAVGTIQATETVKLILGKGQPLVGRLLLYDALEMSFRTLKLKRDPQCPVCGDHPTIRALIDYDEFCGVRGAAPDRIVLQPQHEISAPELFAKLQSGEKPLLLDVRQPHELRICKLPDAYLVPLNRLDEHAADLPRDREIIVYCRSGIRSAKAVKKLLEKGFREVKNLRGGILAWSDEVDSSVPKY